MYIGESDISGGGSVNNMGYGNHNMQNNYNNNNRKSNIITQRRDQVIKPNTNEHQYLKTESKTLKKIANRK